MHDLKLNDLAAYERHIGQSAPELDELIEETIVAESWFFRDESPFDWLRAYIRRGWVSKPAIGPCKSSAWLVPRVRNPIPLQSHSRKKDYPLGDTTSMRLTSAPAGWRGPGGESILRTRFGDRASGVAAGIFDHIPKVTRSIKSCVRQFDSFKAMFSILGSSIKHPSMT